MAPTVQLDSSRCKPNGCTYPKEIQGRFSQPNFLAMKMQQALFGTNSTTLLVMVPYS